MDESINPVAGNGDVIRISDVTTPKSRPGLATTGEWDNENQTKVAIRSKKQQQGLEKT